MDSDYLEGDRIIRGVSVLIPILGFAISEAFVYIGFIDLALGSYFLLLLYCSIGAFLIESESTILQAFLLLPIFRFVNLGMPVFSIDFTVLALPLFYGPLLPGLLLFSQSKALPDVPIVGRKIDSLLFLPVAVGMAVLLAVVEYNLTGQEALIPMWTMNNLIVLSISLVLFVGLAEELLFRGILQQTLVERFGRIVGIGLASLLFGLFHSAYGLLPGIGLAIVVGFVLGGLYETTDSLLLTTVFHGVMNVCIFAVFPYQGSFIGV